MKYKEVLDITKIMDYSLCVRTKKYFLVIDYRKNEAELMVKYEHNPNFNYVTNYIEDYKNLIIFKQISTSIGEITVYEKDSRLF